MTPDTLMKLEQAFALDSTAGEACSYAGISQETFYNFLEKNQAFRERIADLRFRPILKARRAIVNSLDDPNMARWYLEKKARKEFGAEPAGPPIAIQVNIDQDRAEFAA